MSLYFKSFFAALALLAFFAAPAAAQNLYTVSGIHVDATAASSSEALNLAIAQGRPKAWTVLFRRLTRQQDWAREPKLDGAALLRLSRGYTIANERRSTTRYVADVTYIFNPDAVARTLQAAGIAYTQTVAKRIMVVPMAPGFTAGGWAQALIAASRESLVPYTVAGAGDGVNNVNFDTSGWNDVSAAAAKLKVSEAALVQVLQGSGKLIVTVRRLGPGTQPTKTSLDVPLSANTNASYAAAAQAAVRTIEDMWKTRAAVDFSQRGKLNVVAHPMNADQWGAIRTALGTVDNVTGVDVTAMDIGYAQLSLSYQGGVEQLRQAMGEAGLSLTGQGGSWTLALGP